jgi:hypothetical protein
MAKRSSTRLAHAWCSEGAVVYALRMWRYALAESGIRFDASGYRRFSRTSPTLSAKPRTVPETVRDLDHEAFHEPVNHVATSACGRFTQAREFTPANPP